MNNYLRYYCLESSVKHTGTFDGLDSKLWVQNIWMIGPIIQMKTFYFQHNRTVQNGRTVKGQIAGKELRVPGNSLIGCTSSLGTNIWMIGTMRHKRRFTDWRFQYSAREVQWFTFQSITECISRALLDAMEIQSCSSWLLGEAWESKSFVNWLCAKLGYKEMDDWHQLTLEDVYKHGGGRLLSGYYNNSLSTALLSIFLKIIGCCGGFQRVPVGYWDGY